MNIEIQAEVLLILESKTDWINKCPHRLPHNKRSGENYLFLDKNGNVLENGRDFESAKELETYPVTVYRLIPVHLNGQNK